MLVKHQIQLNRAQDTREPSDQPGSFTVQHEWFDHDVVTPTYRMLLTQKVEYWPPPKQATAGGKK